MAKPKMQTITRKDWDKKHKDFKLIGKDKIPYIMVYDNGTKLIPVKIIEATDAEEEEFHTKLDTLVHNTFGKSPDEMEESVASAIDQIRQDSKDIRDFLKKVFSDSDFRAMKNDKDFVQYLKSIYEGVSVNEINSSVNKRRAGAELKQKLKGKRSDGMGKYTATIYGLDSNGKRVELKSLNDLNKYSKFELDESINEGKGANNYFDDLKYNYTKSLRYLDKDEKKEYNKLAKDFFSKISESVVNEGSVANKWNIQSQDIGKLQKKTSFSSETSMPFSLISNLSGGVNSTDKGIVSGHFNKDVVILQFYPKEDSRNDTMYDAVDKKGIIAIDKLMKKQYGLSMVSPFLLKGKRHCSADGEVCSVSNYLVFGGTNESIEERVNLFLEKNVPTDASKWSYYKSQAKKKFDVYPSAYANGWAAKKYKAAGGGWKTEK